MATNFKKSGDVIDWTNGTGSDVSSGDVVVIGNILGVALGDIADGAAGSVQIKNGEFVVPKVSGAVINQGEDLTYDVSVPAFDDNAATPATGDITGAAAVAAADAGSGETTMRVIVTGVPGTVN